MTVTGRWLPSSPKTWVMPTFRPMSPSLRAISAPCRATSSDEPPETRARDDQNGADPKRRGSASPNGEQREARGRSRPERTQLYVRLGDDRERSQAKPVGLASEFDLDVDTGGQGQRHQPGHGAGGGIDDVQQAPIGAHVELIARGR